MNSGSHGAVNGYLLRMRTRYLLGIGVLLVVLAGGTLALHSTADPHIHTLSLGTNPWAVAVDGRTGLAFVVNRPNYGFGTPFGSRLSTSGNARSFIYSGSLSAPTDEDSVSVVDVRAARFLRNVTVGPDPRDAAVDEASGRVFVTNDDNASISVLDAGTGHLVSTISVGDRPHAVTVDTARHQAIAVDSAANSLSVVDTLHLRTVQTLRVGNGVALDGATVVAQGGLIVVGDSTAMHVLDARTGQERPVPSGGYAGVLAIDPGGKQLYVATNVGVQVVRLSDGRVQNTIAVQGEIRAMAVDARRHRLYILQGDTSHDGTLSMIDLRRGAVVTTKPVGLAPTALAVDEQSGRVVVVNQGGSRQVTDRWGFLPDWLRTRLSPILGDPSRIQPVPGSITILDL